MICRRLTFLSPFLPIAFGLAGCASIVTVPPLPAENDLQTELKSQAATAATRQQNYLIRLTDVAGPIMVANAALCPRLRPYYGLTTHSDKSYPEGLRDALKSGGAVNEANTVLHVVADGPADKVGIKAGDMILNEDGASISAKTLRRQTTADNGRADLRIKRGPEMLTLSVQTMPACNYSLGIRHAGTVNAIATGRSITVTTGMMDFTKTDAELAAIIGHELAHNTLSHIRKIATTYVFSGGATRYTRPFETEADYVGLYYAARAGYDIENVEDIWRRIGHHNPVSVGRAKTHPATPDRFLRLKATYAEIEAKRAAGEALIPNFKDAARTPS